MSDENKIRTFDVFCAQCNVQTAARVVAEYTKTTPANSDQAAIDPVDTPYYVAVYELALCGRCEAVFLKESNYYEIPGDIMASQGEEILYPTNRNISMDGIPESITRAYVAAARSYQVGLYEPCVIMCRKCIEALCHQLGATKGNLKSRLAGLQNNGQIDQKLMIWADELRLIGNDAAHDLDVLIEQIDAQDALEFVEAILMYAFSLTRKFEEFKNRQASKNSEKKPKDKKEKNVI